MKAIRKMEPTKGLWMQEIPVPQPGVNEVLIKISKSAICGTDLHIYKWDAWAQKTIKTPMTIGHEYVGTVVGIGDEVTKIHIGERVTVEGHIASVLFKTNLDQREDLLGTDFTSKVSPSRSS